MLETFLQLGLPPAMAFGVAYLYSRALFRGITSARDPQHRLTPQSPWFFFDREFKPRVRWVAIGLVPWIAFGVGVSWIPYWSDIWQWGIAYALGAVVYLYIALQTLGTLGIIGFTLAVITLWGPRFRSPLALALLSPPIGAVYLGVLILGAWAFEGYPVNLAIRNCCLLIIALTLSSAAAFSFAWRYVRFKLDNAWFRFDE